MRKPIHLPMAKGFCAMLGISIFLSSPTLFAQPCPLITNCPQSNYINCDEGENDSLLWNQAPFTFSPTIGNADLHEGPVQLSIKFRGCNGGGLGVISYLLFLDLDNDGLQETVVMSGSPPPAGTLRANNAFNPGYSGGDTVQFDKRPLPDSMLYRFTLETTYSGDTTIGAVRFSTDLLPFAYSPIILPEGKHRIEWRAVQDGVERFCDRNFRVEDCKKPDVTCKPDLAVHLKIDQKVTMTLAEALESVSDNITPDSQLVLGIRRVGMGSGFPYDAFGNPQDTVMFNCGNDENQAIEIWAKDRADNLGFCTAPVLVYDTAGVCPVTPFSSICARTYWNGETIQGVNFKMSWQNANQQPVVNELEVYANGCSDLSSLPPANQFTISAAKNTVPLNGVTTFDLVLISKHILAIDPFTEGWKIAAADANRSNSVTTFDIVELRKMILGLTDHLPNNTPSWRFFVDSCTVWGTPFFGNCPSTYTLPVQPIGFYPPNISFLGLKVGDVNASASSVDTLQSGATSRGDNVSLELPDLQLQKGQMLEIPLRLTEAAAWEGFQFSLAFDPNSLEIEDVFSVGNFQLNRENWAIPEAGKLRLSWSDARPTAFVPGDEILRLRLRSATDARLEDVLRMCDDGHMASEAYASGTSVRPLQLIFSKGSNTVPEGTTEIFSPSPNPTGGAAQLPIRLIAPEFVTTEISTLSGKILWQQSVSLDTGSHLLEIPESAMPRSGVYIWRVFAGNTTRSGRLVRL